MKLPETQNANHLYAFKKGYRLAMEGKTLSLMPSQIKLDSAMKMHFENGWQQYKDDLAEAMENETESPFRNKAIWMVMAMVAGIATAGVMIHKIQQEKQSSPPSQQTNIDPIANSSGAESLKPSATTQPEDFSLISSEKDQPQVQNKPTEVPATPVPKIKKTEPQVSLSLLSQNERNDLELSKQEATSAEAKPERPLEPTDIKITRALLTAEITNKEPGKTYGTIVPKFVRKLYFFTQIQDASGQTLYHRWRYNGRVMATVSLEVKGQNFRTWSSKRLSSAWSGHWVVEVLNSQKQPIYRKTFTYSQ